MVDNYRLEHLKVDFPEPEPPIIPTNLPDSSLNVKSRNPFFR